MRRWRPFFTERLPRLAGVKVNGHHSATPPRSRIRPPDLSVRVDADPGTGLQDQVAIAVEGQGGVTRRQRSDRFAHHLVAPARSEERRGGEEWVSTFRSRWSP